MTFSTDPDPGAAGDDRATRRALLLFAASLVVIGLGGLVAVTVKTRARSPVTGSATTVPARAKTPADALLAAGVGPAPGDDVSAYIADRGRALAAATGDRAAIVSFSSYLSEAQARAAVGPVTVTGVLAAIPGRKPAVVTGPVADWLSAQLADQRAERDEFQKLLPTVDDAQFKTFYRQEIDRLSKLIDGTRADGPLIYAVVVKAPAPALQALAQARDVRLVDVAPIADLKPGTPARGLRPEETARADDPPVRPV